jgi:hypothetical protein
MPYTESEQFELLSRIGAAFWSVFAEAERARTSAFEAEMKAFFVRIAADWKEIGEIESSASGSDRLMVTLLRGRIDALWREVVASIEERGSLADRKYVQFMGLLFPIFGIFDFPSRQDPDGKLLMELLLRPSAAN